MKSFAICIIALVCSNPALADEIKLTPGEVKELTYKATPQGELSIHVHTPKDWKPGDQRPVIVFFFGGGWNSGRVTQFEPQAEYLASRGLVAARADYRVKSRHQVSPKECVEDAKSAIRWVRQHATALGVDPAKVIASGGSAGGHLAACTGLCPGLDAEKEDQSISSKPNALVLFNPVLRFSEIEQMMKRIDGNEELGRAISPTLHLDKNAPPSVIFFGTADRLLMHGEEFVEKAKKVGAKSQLYLTKDQPHGFFNRAPYQQITLRQTDEFLRSLGYLEGEPTIEVPKKK